MRIMSDKIILSGPEDAMQRTRENFYKYTEELGVLKDMDADLPIGSNPEDIMNGIVRDVRFTFSNGLYDKIAAINDPLTKEDVAMIFAVLAADCLNIPRNSPLQFINCVFEGQELFRCKFVYSVECPFVLPAFMEDK